MPKKAGTQRSEPEPTGADGQAAVSRGVPNMRVEVNEGSVIGHEGKEYVGGKRLVLEGPTAINLQHDGIVTIIEEVQ